MREQIKEVEYTLITELYAPRAAAADRDRAPLRRRSIASANARPARSISPIWKSSPYACWQSHPETRARLLRQFDHILMDEFQDTNGQQAKLIGLIRPPDRFYAVGDINQSIFGFRHAEPPASRRTARRSQRRGRRLVELVENFRSRAEILRAVETIDRGAARNREARAGAGPQVRGRAATTRWR